MENLITETMSQMLSYFNEPGTPKITGIRNLQKVDSDKHFYGFTFTFEAEVNGEWLEYGPNVCGNFTIRRDCPEHTLPESNMLFRETCTRTIYLGHYDLEKLYEGKNETNNH